LLIVLDTSGNVTVVVRSGKLLDGRQLLLLA
jgi:hypothetical protein